MLCLYAILSIVVRSNIYVLGVNLSEYLNLNKCILICLCTNITLNFIYADLGLGISIL